MVTTIQIDELLKSKLDSMKVHQRESYNSLLQRIVENFPSETIDTESLTATIEVLSDPKLMKGIKEALEEEMSGKKGTSMKDLKKELKL